jgi:hypothetical protein
MRGTYRLNAVSRIWGTVSETHGHRLDTGLQVCQSSCWRSQPVPSDEVSTETAVSLECDDGYNRHQFNKGKTPLFFQSAHI